MKIIILAGGSGTRLWPLSRTRFPKQFVKLRGMDKSILQMTIERCLKLADLRDIYIVTNEEYGFLISSQIEEMGLTPIPGNILPEPQPKNTLPAIYNGVKHISRTGDDLVAVFPSDHMINDESGFCYAVRQGMELAEKYIVTFGIVATSPETGYGYIQPGEQEGSGFVVRSFKEKPRLEVARQYLQQGYYWNAGMFMFRTDIFDEEVKRYSPEVYEAFLNNDPEECFDNCPSISIDYGVMEHSRRVAVVPMENDWSDLGSFAAIYEAYGDLKDGSGNVADDNCIIVDSHNSMVMGDTDKPIALVGLDGVVVIDNVDATLVCSMSQTQKVKDVVAALKQKQHKALDAHNINIRPWGCCIILEERQGYKVKRLTIMPGKTLSQQNRQLRSWHWTVVRGSALANLVGQEITMRVGDGLFIEAGQAHRLHNPDADEVLEIIEVETGARLGEGDLERPEDGRPDYF